MDSNATLAEMRALAARMIRAYEDVDGNGIDQDDAVRLAELCEALDVWITIGGFPPRRWQKEG